MSTSPYVDVSMRAHTDEWALQVGRFVMAFGEIEWMVCQTLVHIPTENLYEKLRKENPRAEFNVLAKKAIECSQARGLLPELCRALVRSLNEAIKLAEHRNLVAHNPMHFSMYTDEHERQIGFRMEIVSLRNQDKSVTLEELARLAADAERLYLSMFEAFQCAYNHLHPLTDADFT
jgi:hypothetical protein